MHRGAPAVVLVGVIVLSGLAVAGGAPAGGDRAPPDPASDVLGWENGYWYNETLSINQTDGLSASERRAVVARSMARIEYLRGLEFHEAVPVSVVSRENYTARVANRTTNDTLRAFDNAKFEALFLVNESADSIGVQNENSGASVLGYYDPATDEIVLVAENESAARIDEATLAHELVHALQDQHYNLSNYRGETRDEVNAYNGLIEGDASYVEYLYVDERCNEPENPWNGTCVSPPPSEGGGSGSLANIGVYFLKFQPYSDGPAFVRSVRERGGWEAVNALYEAPPESAEQVIHPEKYGEDAPTNVSLADDASGSWTRLSPPDRPAYAEVGQAGVASMLVYPLYESDGRTRIVSPQVWLNVTSDGAVSQFDPLNYGFDAAAGWDGDRMHVYRNDANETGYVWRIVWDSPADAREFVASYRQVVEFRGGTAIDDRTYRIDRGGFADAIYLDRAGDAVTIVNAPTVDGLSAVYGGVDRATPTPTATASDPSPETPPGTTRSATAEPSSPSPGAETTTPGQPGFGVVAVLLALLALGAHAALRSRS